MTMINDVDAAQVRRKLDDAGVRLVAMTMVDNGGITRLKAVPLRRLESVARAGVGMSEVWAVSGVDDHFAFAHAPSYDNPSGDMRLLPDLEAAVALAAAPGWAWAPAVQHDQELRVLDVCQRSALARLVADSARNGLTFKASFELELTLLREDLTPAHEGPGYSARALLGLQDFAVELVDALEAQGIDVDQVHPEYSPGQFEVSVGASDPVTAADRLVLMRITVRQVAARYGLVASFAPIVLAGGVGNGCHLHLSAWRDDQNLMTSGKEPGGLLPEGASLVAGMVAHLPALTCVVAPSAASYLRLQPSHWAGAYTAWGVENREGALRLIPGSASTRERSANIELKTVDGCANPYLAVLATIAAALDGRTRSLALPAPVQRDPHTLGDEERAAAGIRRLPQSLTEAADELERCAMLRSAFGPRLFEAFLAVRRMEAETFAEADAQRLAEAHRFAY
jgi:glutamine synthetase